MFCVYGRQSVPANGSVLSRERAANRLAEALRIRWAFREDEVAVDEQRPFDVGCATGLELFDRRRKEVHGGFATRE